MSLGVDSSRAGEGSASRPLLMCNSHSVACGFGVVPVVVDVGVCAFLCAFFAMPVNEAHDRIDGFGHGVYWCSEPV